MNTKKIFTGILSSAFLFSGWQVSLALAEEVVAPKDVTFTVTVGKLVCEKGTGSSSVSFENFPKEGGYYEITGEMINKNNISLSRKVTLPTGTYFWNGVPQSGYSTTTASSGSFTIKECPKTNTPVVATKPLTVNPKITSIVEKTDSSNEMIEATTTVKGETKENVIPPGQKEPRSIQKNIIAITLLVCAVLAFGFWKKYGKKKEMIDEVK